MVNLFFYIILSVLILDYLLERLLAYLNSTYWSDHLPKELEGIYDQDKYRRSQQYEKSKQKFAFVLSTLTLLAMLFMLVAGGFAWMDAFVRQYTHYSHPDGTPFLRNPGARFQPALVAFDIYHVLYWRKNSGSTATTAKTFILDRLKGLLLSIIIGGGILSLIILIYESTGNYFWMIAWGIISFFDGLYINVLFQPYCSAF